MFESNWGHNYMINIVNHSATGTPFNIMVCITNKAECSRSTVKEMRANLWENVQAYFGRLSCVTLQ